MSAASISYWVATGTKCWRHARTFGDYDRLSSGWFSDWQIRMSRADNFLFDFFPAKQEREMQAAEAAAAAEQWREITGFAGYSVSDHGRVRNDQTGRQKALTPDRDGYLRVQLFNQGHATNCRVHRLVVEAFIGPIAEGLECDHVDRDPTNNHVENLTIVSRGENQRNKSRYRGRDVEYVDELPDGSEPLLEVRGRQIADGYFRNGNDFFVRVHDQYRRLTHTRHNRNGWQVELRTPDGGSLQISWTP
jgi:hypothetical protein